MRCRCGCGRDAKPGNVYLHGHAGGAAVKRSAADEREQFWAKVDIRGDAECWPWLASTRHGYGQMRRHGSRAISPAHVMAYEFLVDVVPDGFDLHHVCEWRSCCNPAHMHPMPHADHASLHSSRPRPSRRRAEPRHGTRHGGTDGTTR